jgi:sulfite exporter TauE/SafE
VTPYLLVFLAGLAGSMHCIGMCGGFACGLGADARGGAASLRRHLLYNLGRVSSYCFLGTAVGHAGLLLAGSGVQSPGNWGVAAQRVIALLSGALMVGVGLQFLGGWRRSRVADPVRTAEAGAGWWRTAPGAVQGALAHALGRLVRAPGAGAPLALGVLNGFLPCPLVYAFVAQTATCGGALNGLQLMATFGLGTFPAMLAMGGLGLWWRGRAPQAVPMHAAFLPAPRAPTLRWREHGVRLAGAFIVALGLLTLARAWLPVAGGLHGH